MRVHVRTTTCAYVWLPKHASYMWWICNTPHPPQEYETQNKMQFNWVRVYMYDTVNMQCLRISYECVTNPHTLQEYETQNKMQPIWMRAPSKGKFLDSQFSVYLLYASIFEEASKISIFLSLMAKQYHALHQKFWKISAVCIWLCTITSMLTLENVSMSDSDGEFYSTIFNAYTKLFTLYFYC